MSQYKVGTVTVTTGDATVTGVGTTWLTGAPIAAADWFSIDESGVMYQIGSITDDTHFELSSNYAGASASAQTYWIMRDFTTPWDFPLMTAGDSDTPTIYNRLVAMLNAKFGTAAYTAGRVTFADASGNLTTDAGLAYNSTTDVLTVGALTVFTGALTLPLVKIDTNGSIEDHLTNGLGGIAINFSGYQGGTTQFRNFNIYDGKQVQIAGFTGSTKALNVVGALTVGTTIKPGGYTVATLPAGAAGMKAYVTDAVAPAFLALLVGGGAEYSGAQYSGANWVGD